MENRIDPLALLLHDASRVLRKRFEARAACFGLSSAQWRLLGYLMREGPATQARLAELLDIEPISVSRLVDRMEQADWVQRQPDPNDRRVKIIEPTARAKAHHTDIRTLARGVYAEATDGLSDSENATLVAALKTIIRNLGDADAAPPALDLKETTK